MCYSDQEWWQVTAQKSLLIRRRTPPIIVCYSVGSVKINKEKSVFIFLVRGINDPRRL